MSKIIGHGHVRHRPDGSKARCGGPTICIDCKYELSVADACKRKYKNLIGPIREIARQCGYAISVHGSVARDIDLVATPWASIAFSAEYLVLSIAQVAAKHNFDMAHFNPPFDEPGIKPHGRRAWCIHLGAGAYIDLSVMPRIEDRA